MATVHTPISNGGRPCGPMDKASDYESGDSRFESWQGRNIATRTLTELLQGHLEVYNEDNLNT